MVPIIKTNAIVAAAAAREPFVPIPCLQNGKGDGYEESQKGPDENLQRGVTLYFLDGSILDSQSPRYFTPQKVERTGLESGRAPDPERIAYHDQSKAEGDDEEG
jgi:hypothetical protein